MTPVQLNGAFASKLDYTANVAAVLAAAQASLAPVAPATSTTLDVLGNGTAATGAPVDTELAWGSGLSQSCAAGTPPVCSISVALSYSQFPALQANQLLGSLATGAPVGISFPSCNGANQAINWTSGSGPGCVTIAGGGGGGTFSLTGAANAGHLVSLVSGTVGQDSGLPTSSVVLSTGTASLGSGSLSVAPISGGSTEVVLIYGGNSSVNVPTIGADGTGNYGMNLVSDGQLNLYNSFNSPTLMATLNTSSGLNVLTGGLGVGGVPALISPFFNVKQANHGCAAAAGDNSTDDTAAIQCNLNWFYSSSPGNGGELYFPPGNYLVSSTLFEYGNTRMVGADRGASQIRTNSNITVLEITGAPGTGVNPGCGAGNIFGSVEHLGIIGYTGGGPTANTVIIGENCPATINDANIWFGYTGLLTYGSDAHIENSQICGYQYCVYSLGNSWYLRDKLDVLGAYTIVAAFFQGSPYCGGCYENHLTQVDLQNGGGNYSLWINDGSGTTVTTVSDSIFGGAVLDNGGRALLMTGDEFGNNTNTINSGAASITSSWSAVGTFTVGGSVATRGCANVQINTSGGCGP